MLIFEKGRRIPEHSPEHRILSDDTGLYGLVSESRTLCQGTSLTKRLVIYIYVYKYFVDFDSQQTYVTVYHTIVVYPDM